MPSGQTGTAVSEDQLLEQRIQGLAEAYGLLAPAPTSSGLDLPGQALFAPMPENGTFASFDPLQQNAPLGALFPTAS